jgi:peptidoglycan/xylan/chitin deacetylase (PgdA/CDA1 family)
MGLGGSPWSEKIASNHVLPLAYAAVSCEFSRMASTSQLVFRGARALGLDAVARRLRPGAVVLCYHNVVVDAAVGADRALHLPVEALREQLAWLARRFHIVSLDELHARATKGQSLRGLAAVTFDDAYRGTLTHGRAVLRALGAPATVFVPTASPASGAPFWWDVVPNSVTASPEGRHEALETLAGDRGAILAAHGTGATALHPDSLPATWDEIAAAQDDAFRFEAHSVTHRNLTRLPAEALRAELVDAADELERRLGRRPHWVAYPYGRWDATVAVATQAAGYRGGFTLDGHDVTPQTMWAQAPRINVPAGISLAAFAAWVSGFVHWRASRG